MAGEISLLEGVLPGVLLKHLAIWCLRTSWVRFLKTGSVCVTHWTSVVSASVLFSHNHFECQVWLKHRIPTLKDHTKHIRKDLHTLNVGFIQVCHSAWRSRSLPQRQHLATQIRFRATTGFGGIKDGVLLSLFGLRPRPTILCRSQWDRLNRGKNRRKQTPQTRRYSLFICYSHIQKDKNTMNWSNIAPWFSSFMVFPPFQEYRVFSGFSSAPKSPLIPRLTLPFPPWSDACEPFPALSAPEISLKPCEAIFQNTTNLEENLILISFIYSYKYIYIYIYTVYVLNYIYAWFCIHWDVSPSCAYHEDEYLF